MSDEIETTAQLVELSVLHQVVVDELIAARHADPDSQGIDLPPEELHAPDSPDDDAAVEVSTQLDDHQLRVRCRIEACNAYGAFAVGGEAVFDLPTRVSTRQPTIVGEFTQLVALPVLYPYLRAAVASLAGQLSVPASPLPLLNTGGMTLVPEAAVEDEPSEFFMHGTMSTTSDDGSQEQIAEFFLDPETGLISRFGGEGQTPELDELLNAIADLPPPDEISAEWMVRHHGEAAAREFIEAYRADHGDDATDNFLAEIDQAVASIEVEEALAALATAVDELNGAAAAFDNTDDPVTCGDVHDPRDNKQLLQAADVVRGSWERVLNAIG